MSPGAFFEFYEIRTAHMTAAYEGNGQWQGSGDAYEDLRKSGMVIY